MSLPRFVFVVGCQRSGTTLLGQMLGAHPDAVLVDEDEGAYALVQAIIDQQPVLPELERLLPRARQKYLDARRQAADMPTHVVLKAPNATFHADALARAAHPLAFIFAARDVREVVHSMSRLHEVPMIENQHRRMAGAEAIARRHAAQVALLADPDVPAHVKYATIWQVKTGLYADFCRPPLDALLVRYDQLVQDNEAWLARMQAHVGLPVLASAPHHEVMQGTAVGRTDRRRAVDASSRAKWKDALTAQQLHDIRVVAGPLMDELSLPW
jgi:hypothetical protein